MKRQTFGSGAAAPLNAPRTIKLKPLRYYITVFMGLNNGCASAAFGDGLGGSAANRSSLLVGACPAHG